MFEAINPMFPNMLTAVARKDSPIAGAGRPRPKADGLYKGNAEHVARNGGIAQMLSSGQSWSSMQAATSYSPATAAKIAKVVRAAA
jgi:hypothetical protein